MNTEQQPNYEKLISYSLHVYLGKDCPKGFLTLVYKLSYFTIYTIVVQ